MTTILPLSFPWPGTRTFSTAIPGPVASLCKTTVSRQILHPPTYPSIQHNHPPTHLLTGKSQESSSEAINAYYGAHLFGRATGDKKLERYVPIPPTSPKHLAIFHLPRSSPTHPPTYSI